MPDKARPWCHHLRKALLFPVENTKRYETPFMWSRLTTVNSAHRCALSIAWRITSAWSGHHRSEAVVPGVITLATSARSPSSFGYGKVSLLKLFPDLKIGILKICLRAVFTDLWSMWQRSWAQQTMACYPWCLHVFEGQLSPRHKLILHNLAKCDPKWCSKIAPQPVVVNEDWQAAWQRQSNLLSIVAQHGQKNVPKSAWFAQDGPIHPRLT